MIKEIKQLLNIILPKKISEKEKEKIISGFLIGESIEDLSKTFKLSKITISRYLKKSVGDIKYKHLNEKYKNQKKELKLDNNKISISENQNNDIAGENAFFEENGFLDEAFVEIEPLNYEIDNTPRKDLSSVPISEVDLPNIVYMIVDKKIELETKYLYEYPDWQFLSKEELNRKTIEIFFDLKVAKRFCNKEQKVIKVPNSNVFRITSSLLLDKGISRIVSTNKLIAL
tara:strand:- start:1397 stop:2083 length:687 start_codon:yes stop_codon:yes gene_type:complete